MKLSEEKSPAPVPEETEKSCENVETTDNKVEGDSAKAPPLPKSFAYFERTWPSLSKSQRIEYFRVSFRSTF